MYLLRINHDDGCTCIRVELRHEQMIYEDGVEALWTIMLAYVRDVDNLLHNFSGKLKTNGVNIKFFNFVSQLKVCLIGKHT